MKRLSYKTSYLDLASYLVSEGHDCSIVKRGVLNAVFSFDADVIKLATAFLQGRATANLTHYLFTRTSLKRRIAALPTPVHVSSHEAPSVRLGSKYWYLEDGKIWGALYADREPHTDRFKLGNSYPTRAAALAALAKTK